MFEIDESRRYKPEDMYHFVGFVPINGTVYELDGLKTNPVRVANIPDGKSWLDVILPILTTRMQEHADGRFNLMAIVPSRLQKYQKLAAEYAKNPPVCLKLIFVYCLLNFVYHLG